MSSFGPRPLRWLYLDLNSFFASVEQQLDPALRGRPVAVGPGHLESGTIIAASYEAKAFGVTTGMRVGEARRRCPDLAFAGGSHARYVRVHKAVVAEVWRHIPVTHVCSIDEVACRLLDNENASNAALALARRIKTGIRRSVGECLTSSIGIAPSRLTAKIAADMRKPDGLTLIEAGDLPRVLHPLPLDSVPGIGPRMKARLAAAGIHDMETLLTRDPRTARGAWGSIIGTRMWLALHGVDLAEPGQRSRSIGHSHVLAPSRRDPETVRLTARRLLMKAGTRLRAAGMLAAHVSLHARLEDGGTTVLGARSPPTDDSFRLVALLDRLWPQLVARLGSRRVRTIGISLDNVQPAACCQPSLFDPPPGPRAALCSAIDRLNARYGASAVTLGLVPHARQDAPGQRIAFHRIPDLAEFDPESADSAVPFPGTGLPQAAPLRRADDRATDVRRPPAPHHARAHCRTRAQRG